MNLIARLFSKTPSVADIRRQLEELEHDQRRRRRDLTMLDLKKQEKVKQAIEAKKAGRDALLRELFRDTSQVEIEIGNANNDLRRLSLAKIALNSFMREMELLEKRKDRKGLQNLITRINNSSIQKAIDAAEVGDDSFNEMLADIVGEEEVSATRAKDKDDIGFEEFEKAIGVMAQSDKDSVGEQASAVIAPIAGAEPLEASTIRAHGLQLPRAEEQIARLQRQIIELQQQIQQNRHQEKVLPPEISSRQPMITIQDASATAARAAALHAQAHASAARAAHLHAQAAEQARDPNMSDQAARTESEAARSNEQAQAQEAEAAALDLRAQEEAAREAANREREAPPIELQQQIQHMRHQGQVLPPEISSRQPMITTQDASATAAAAAEAHAQAAAYAAAAAEAHAQAQALHNNPATSEREQEEAMRRAVELDAQAHAEAAKATELDAQARAEADRAADHEREAHVRPMSESEKPRMPGQVLHPEIPSRRSTITTQDASAIAAAAAEAHAQAAAYAAAAAEAHAQAQALHNNPATSEREQEEAMRRAVELDAQAHAEAAKATELDAQARAEADRAADHEREAHVRPMSESEKPRMP